MIREKIMFEEMTEQQAREEILKLTKEYCEKYHNNKKPYEKGDRIPYASRVYDSEEMVNLVDSSLEFWLTAGRYTSEFEHEFAKYLGVRYCSLVNSGSSANLLAFMTLTSPLLKERQILPGDEVITVAAGFPTTVAPIIQYGAVPVLLMWRSRSTTSIRSFWRVHILQRPRQSCWLILLEIHLTLRQSKASVIVTTSG